MDIPLELLGGGELSIDTMLWGVVGAMVLLFGVYSAVLLWHWNEYSTGKFTTVANMLVYILVGDGLLVLMGLAAFWNTSL